MSYAVGVNVPVSQMPAGMAFDNSAPAKPNLFNSIGSGFMRGIEGGLGDIFAGSSGGSSGGYGSSGSPYVDDTKRLMQSLMLSSLSSFDPSRIRSVI